MVGRERHDVSRARRTPRHRAPGGRSGAHLTEHAHQARGLLWRTALISSLGLATIAASKLVDGLLPVSWIERLGADSLPTLLDILANSMLTVTTFSLGILVTVFWAASAQLTPRAHRELLADRITQTVIATFIGAWIFALTSRVLIATPLFGPQELVALFLATIGVLVLVVAAVLRWAMHLQTFGTLIDTGAEIEEATELAMRQAPWLGLPPLPERLPDVAVPADSTGYVQSVDVAALRALAAAKDVEIAVLAIPGRFVIEGQTLARVSRADPGLAAPIRDAVPLGALRTVEQDPRFGLIQLSEIGSKALSPAVNDPGTAIDMLGRATRLLRLWPERPAGAGPVSMDAPDAGDAVGDAYAAIARDGAALVEVQIALQRRLSALIAHGPESLRDALGAMRAEALKRARAKLTPGDLARVEAAARDGIRE